MAKNRPGLPDGFELKVDSPSQLGDYLDEDVAGNAARALSALRITEQETVAKPQPKPALVSPTMSKPLRQDPVLPPPAMTELSAEVREPRRTNPSKAAMFRRPDRKEFNMRPETVKMVKDLVEFVQRYSLQSDAKASEIFDAIVSTLHDARKEMAFDDVPRRGKWGTPTARAFPIALGNAFARAIATRYLKQNPE